MTKRVKMVRGSGNVFRDLGFPAEEARNLLLRSQIMICIEQFVERSGLTQARVAARLGLTQPRLNALLKGKIDQFSLDALVSRGYACKPVWNSTMCSNLEYSPSRKEKFTYNSPSNKEKYGSYESNGCGIHSLEAGRETG